MPGRIEDGLSRFTPSLGGLNRDELLFAAGRASARPDRKWPTLAALLALSQALTLALLCTGTPTLPRAEPTPPPVPSDTVPVVSPIARDWRSALDEPPVVVMPTEDLVPDEPPLHVYSAWDERPPAPP